MSFNVIGLDQAIFPLAIAISYIIYSIYVFAWHKAKSAIGRSFIAYALVVALWSFGLLAAVNNAPQLLPDLTWARLMSYSLIVLGVGYWIFSRAFLQKARRVIFLLLLGIAGLALTVSIDMDWLPVSPEALAWSNGWVHEQNISFILSVIWWGLFMGIAALNVVWQQFRTKNPAHKNRIQYLIIMTLVTIAGYGLYLTLREPFWTIGLIVVALSGILATYIVVAENLIDLGTGIRRLTRSIVVSLVTVAIYLLAFYLVQIFLGDFLVTTFGGRIENTLLIATAAMVVMTILFMPIRQGTRHIVDRVLFGRSYDYQVVIQGYGQVISNRLYLGELATLATEYINQTLDLQKSSLFIFDSESDGSFHFRNLPATSLNGSGPKELSLKKETPITDHLLEERSPLAQYHIDISSKFEQAPRSDRNALKGLNCEWFVPIHKENDWVGILAVGTKKSGRPYTSIDLALLGTLADQTALALENAKLFDRVQRNLEEITSMKNLMDNVFDSMDNGVITTDVDGRITFYNQAAEAILAMRLDHAVGSAYLEVLSPLADTIFPNLVSNVIHREDRYTDYEIISEFPQRGRVNLSLNLTSLKDAHDITQGVTIVVDDQTETKRLQAVHDMFRRYVSPAVVDRLPSDPGDLELGGQRQETTILFADIRGFTTFSEKLAPEELVDVLNQYLSMAASSILMYEGTLDKFMGDAVMGIFNAPLKQEDHVLRAVRAAAAMQRAIADYHRNLDEARGLQFGVGLHVGEVVVGNVGMSDRMDYTAIGDAVNLAKRIQENTPGGKILMSSDVYHMVRDEVNADYYDEIKVKGRQQPVKIYELLLS